jgi:hypothetical protein
MSDPYASGAATLTMASLPGRQLIGATQPPIAIYRNSGER